MTKAAVRTTDGVEMEVILKSGDTPAKVVRRYFGRRTTLQGVWRVELSFAGGENVPTVTVSKCYPH